MRTWLDEWLQLPKSNVIHNVITSWSAFQVERVVDAFVCFIIDWIFLWLQIDL